MDSAEPHQLSAELQQTARSLGRLLLQHGQRVVFAESCTAGLVAASLAIVPGISRCLCGSLVTYREASKTAWLGVDAQLIAAFTAVSPEVTAQMASAALQRTIEADWAAAVTGHLGPDAPPGSDGTIHIAVARRLKRAIPQSTGFDAGPFELTVQLKQQLSAPTRVLRQQQAAGSVLATLEQALRSKLEPA